jgi:hypothetical protein
LEFGRIGSRSGTETANNLTVAADEELVEVPFDLAGELRVLRQISK